MIPLPLPKAGKLPYVVGVDSKGCEKVLPHQPNSFLFTPDGSVASSWYDGSKEQPIITPNFDKSNVAAESVMVVDAQGRWYRLVPDDVGGSKKQLVHEAGAVYFEDMKTQLCHAEDDVEGLANCGFEFAVWSKCTDGAGILCLKKATKEELFGEEATDECEDAASAGYSGIVMRRVIDGVMQEFCVKPTCNKVIEACCIDGGDPVWRIADRGLGYHPFDSPVNLINTTGVGVFPVTLPSFPDKTCGKIVAKFKSTMNAGDGASGAAHARTLLHGGVAIAASGFHDNVDICYPEINVTAEAQSFTITMYGSSTGSCKLDFLGYFY